MKSLLLFFLCAAVARAAELTAPERATLLSDLRELHAQHPTLQADFVEQKTTHLLNKPLTSEGTIWFSVPDKFRREVRGNNATTTVSDGRTMWIYYPNFKEAELYVLGQRAFFDDSISALTAGLNFQRIDEFYNFRAWHEDGIWRLELTPKKPSLKRIVQQLILTLDSEFHPRKTELVLPKGDRLVTNYTSVRRPPLPASTFEFSPPPDAHVSRPLGK
ncbi:MAG: outer rane lipoprotein carrier protein [Chthoniobacter sp.]|jgi:outer membrane lipoprotein-sorting protein|nr:outer rane lipoprotein carrier protein [Chthoniobacter sp.]